MMVLKVHVQMGVFSGGKGVILSSVSETDSFKLESAGGKYGWDALIAALQHMWHVFQNKLNVPVKAVK